MVGLDPNFDIDSHVLASPCPARPEGPSWKVVAGQISQNLDHSKPLWQFQLMENCRRRSGAVRRIHHCIADGIALMGVLHSLTDSARDAPEEGDASPWLDTGGDSEEDSFWHRLIAPLGVALVKALRVSARPAPVRCACSQSRSGCSITRSWRPASRRTDSTRHHAGRLADPLKGKPAVAKRLAWAEPMPLAEIKAVGGILAAR